MAERFRVEPAVVTVGAGQLTSLAGDKAWSPSPDTLTEAARAARGSDVSAEATALAGEVRDLVAELTARLALMGQTASATSINYVGADAFCRSSFTRIAMELPAASLGAVAPAGGGPAQWGAW